MLSMWYILEKKNMGDKTKLSKKILFHKIYWMVWKRSLILEIV